MTIKVTMMVGITRCEAVATDVVVGLDAFDHVHRERQSRDPGLASILVLQIELRRCCVLQPRFRPQIIDRPN